MSEIGFILPGCERKGESYQYRVLVRFSESRQEGKEVLKVFWSKVICEEFSFEYDKSRVEQEMDGTVLGILNESSFGPFFFFYSVAKML